MATPALGTIVSKIRHTSGAELWWRGRTFVDRWAEEASDLLPRWRPGLGRGSADRFPGAFLSADDVDAVADRLRRDAPAYVSETIAAADEIAAHRFRFFGRDAHFGTHVRWQSDPVTGREWPSQFHARIEIFDPAAGAGDVKYVWELNRHQFLPILGKAYRLTGERRYADAAVSLMTSWVAENPYRHGVNWTSALEVAIRALSWCTTLPLVDVGDHIPEAARRALRTSLAQHLAYIERHLSFYFSPYNHLVGEAAALAVGGALSSTADGRRWRDRGWTILAGEARRQLHADGGTVEQASGYHHFTLGFYLHALIMRRRLGLTVDPDVTARCERALEFSMALTRPDGCLPMIGDADEGRSLDLHQPAGFDFRGMLAVGAALLERPDFKAVAGAFPPDAAWLVGSAGWDRYEALLPTPPVQTSMARTDSGYYVMRDSWSDSAHYLLFDCGELSAGVRSDAVASAAHGHADALSIEVSVFGTPAIVDPGFLTYNGPLEWHRYFRETHAHNTAVVDGRSQAEYAGRLKWTHGPQVVPLAWCSSDFWDVASGEHSGYDRLPQRVSHRRTVVFVKPGYWLVRDDFTGAGQHDVDRYFHLAPLPVVYDASTGVRVSAGRADLLIAPLERDDTVVTILHGGERPEEGWIATGYDTKIAAPVVRLHDCARLPLTLHTLLLPVAAGAGAPCVKAIEWGEGCTAFEVDAGTGTDLWLSAPQGAPTHDYPGGWSSDATLALIRRGSDGAAYAAGIFGGSTLQHEGRDFVGLHHGTHA